MWSKPLSRRVLKGEVEDIDWVLDMYLDYNNHIESANLKLWVDNVPITLSNVFSQKHNSLYKQVYDLLLDPAIRDMLITDIITHMNRQGIIPGPILR